MSLEKESPEVAQHTEDSGKEMRAIVLTSFGGLKAVRVLKKPEPKPAEGEVLVRVKACGLNFQDLMARQGALDAPKTPFIMGFECAGIVEAVAKENSKLKVNDRVVVFTDYSAWSELITVKEEHACLIPNEMTFHEAAALIMNYSVAYILLFDLGGLTPNKTVLVHSVGGGVGHAVVQLSRTVEEIRLIGIASQSKHDTLAGGLSIDHLIERGTDYAIEVRKINPDGVDIVLDCMCGEDCGKGYNLLKPMGKYILYGTGNVVTGETKSLFSAARSWWHVDKYSPVKLFDENKTIAGLNLRHLIFKQNGIGYVKEVVGKVFDLWEQGKIKPVIDSTWAFEDVTEAMQKMHDRKNIGKILLDPTQSPKEKPAALAKGKKSDSDDKKDEAAPDKNEIEVAGKENES